MSKHERWRRDDGWEVSLVVEDGLIISTTHIPTIVPPRPNPLTYEYMKLALEVHGYVKI